jgi:hypothetical protein
MKQILAVLGFLMLAACSPSEPPATATPPRKVVKPEPPAPQKPQEPPSSAPSGGASEGKPAPVMPSPKADSEVRKVPRAAGISGDIHLPAFTFRSLTGGANIQINGELLGTAPCLWSVTNGMEFDPKIRVETWPPENAEKIGTTNNPETGSAEVWLDQSDGVAKRFPHLRPGEAVLYVDGTLGGRQVRGALRLLVEGFKNVVYTPLVNPEGEEASRYLRSIWFDRKQN